MPDDDDFTPQFDNQEQDDGDQAQDVAAGAVAGEDGGFEDSEHGGTTNPAQLIPDDVPDTVDLMEQMVRSGRIDNGAFAGEPQHDDEEAIRGDTEDME